LEFGCSRHEEHARELNPGWYINERTCQEVKNFLPESKLSNRLQNVIKVDKAAFILGKNRATIKPEF